MHRLSRQAGHLGHHMYRRSQDWKRISLVSIRTTGLLLTSHPHLHCLVGQDLRTGLAQLQSQELLRCDRELV
jgi:pyrimidine operon attenuation protein/uracil phosphoribosyltransferase